MWRNGYRPVPALGKAPKMQGWRDIPLSELEIRMWRAERPRETNTGAVCGELAVVCESERARFVRYEDACASKGSAARQAPGYWWKEPDGAVSLLIPRDRWRSICKGMDPVAVAKALHKQGLLLRPVSGTSFLWHLSARWLPGAPKPPKIPYYKLKMEIFDRA